MTDEWAGILGPAERDAVCARIDGWAARELATGGALVAVDRQAGGDPVTGRPPLVPAAGGATRRSSSPCG